MQTLDETTLMPSHQEDDVEAGQCFEGMREELGFADGFVASHGQVGMNRPPIQR